ncbi:ras-related protein Rab-34-like [Macrosteles quadrilineatus]|uniref:ras-related protein Rab-34-like n=1 Tax=Macrosteles quadrilineatus TaxID=74068 RepID=UPI0023E11D28|nr:ras-related protein Rab-34-like [Macrosteles quadrilineatus]
MYESRSATYKIMQQEAPKNRQILKMPNPYKVLATPFLEHDFCQKTLPAHTCMRIAKAIFLGDVAVGKTCIINRFCHNAYDNDYKTTIGVDFEVERFDILNTPFSLQIWDTAGQERFRSIASSYYRGAHILVLVFDFTSVRTLFSCASWLRDAMRVNPQAPLVFLLGNKMDLVSQASRCEMEKIAIKTATQLGAEFWPVSARTGENIEEVFRRMAALAYHRILCIEEERKINIMTIGNIDGPRKLTNKVLKKKKSACIDCYT